MIQDPFDLGAGEIGVDQKTGGLADVVGETALYQVFADIGCTAALPNDGVGDGLAGVLFPYDHRFALVGDADRRDVTWVDPALGYCLCHDTELRGIDLGRVVLDPSLFGIILCEFAL